MVETASHLKQLPTSIWHIGSVWAHWYAVHWHLAAALHSFTHPTWLRFWGSGAHVESKWCDYDMVETDSHLKQLPTSIWHVESVWVHWYDVHWHTTFGSLVESKWCDNVMFEADSHLKLLSTLSTWDITKCLSALICLILLLLSSCWCLCCQFTGFFTVVELAPCPGTITLLIRLVLSPLLSMSLASQ